MTQYVLFLPGVEDQWAAATPDERAATYARHEAFVTLLAARGHSVDGGAELTHSRAAKVVRGDLDAVTVTDGPFAETVEQISGFYLVSTDDLDDLLQVCGQLSGTDGAVEVRAAVSAPSPRETSASGAAVAS